MSQVVVAVVFVHASDELENVEATAFLMITSGLLKTTKHD
jgi:hypothetical protein